MERRQCSQRRKPCLRSVHEDVFILCPPCSIFDADSATTNAVNDKDNPLLGGVWLHRPAEPAVVTPEPASLLLLGSGLLSGIRRYRKNRS